MVAAAAALPQDLRACLTGVAEVMARVAYMEGSVRLLNSRDVVDDSVCSAVVRW